MSYNVPGGGSVSATSAVQFTGSPLRTGVERELASLQDGDDIYISFLTKWESGEVNGNDFVIWYFNSNSGPRHGRPLPHANANRNPHAYPAASASKP